MKKKNLSSTVANVLLVSSVFLGFIFPGHAKWILLILVVMGLTSWALKKEA